MQGWIKNLTLARKFLLVGLAALAMLAIPSTIALRRMADDLAALQQHPSGTIRLALNNFAAVSYMPRLLERIREIHRVGERWQCVFHCGSPFFSQGC